MCNRVLTRLGLGKVILISLGIREAIPRLSVLTEGLSQLKERRKVDAYNQAEEAWEKARPSLNEEESQENSSTTHEKRGHEG